MRPRAAFGMTLKTERWFVGQLESLQCAIEQRHMCHARIFRQRPRVHRKAVILAGDHHFISLDILNRMVRAAMAELHLHGLRTHCQAHDLMP